MKIKIICDNYKETSHVMIDALLEKQRNTTFPKGRETLQTTPAPNINQ